MGKDCLRNIEALGRDALDLDLKSMARKMLSDIDPRQFSILCRTSYHRKYFDHLGAFKHRHRITDGASRGLTSVPTDHNTIKFCALHLNVRHDDHGTPRFEQCSLDDRYFLLRLVRLGLTDHGEVEATSKSTERIADMARRDVYHLRLGHNTSLLGQCFKANYGLVSTPERSCIGSPERRCINDDGKKAPNWGPFRQASGLGGIIRQCIRVDTACE